MFKTLKTKQVFVSKIDVFPHPLLPHHTNTLLFVMLFPMKSHSISISRTGVINRTKNLTLGDHSNIEAIVIALVQDTYSHQALSINEMSFQ